MIFREKAAPSHSLALLYSYVASFPGYHGNEANSVPKSADTGYLCFYYACVWTTRSLELRLPCVHPCKQCCNQMFPDSPHPVAVQHAPKEIRKPFKEACFLHRAGTGSVFPTPTSIYTLQEDFLHFCRKYYRYPKCTGTCMKVRHLVGLDFSTLYLLHKCRKISGTDTVKIWNYLKIFPALQPLYMVAFSPWFSFFWNMFGDNNSDGKLGSYVELQSNPTHITTRQ